MAIEELNEAIAAFSDANTDNFTELCTALRQALESRIMLCGDPEGLFAAQIEALGDCLPPEENDGQLRVDFDGETYVSDIVVATTVDNAINISGLRGSEGEIITLTVFGDSEGTYQLGVPSDNDPLLFNAGAYIEANNTGEGVWATFSVTNTSQGEVIISEIDTENQTMSGTFSFTGTNGFNNETKEFTNGSFTDVPFDNPVSNGNSTFFARVDGEEFIEDTIQGLSANVGGISSLGIVANKNNGETIAFNLDIDIAVGEYTLEEFMAPNALYNLSTTLVHTGEGTLIITEHDIPNKHIVGTFVFTANPATGSESMQSYEITEGAFDVFYN